MVMNLFDSDKSTRESAELTASASAAFRNRSCDGDGVYGRVDHVPRPIFAEFPCDWCISLGSRAPVYEDEVAPFISKDHGRTVTSCLVSAHHL